jgi:polyisoprenoid-binding protein YceI
MKLLFSYLSILLLSAGVFSFSVQNNWKLGKDYSIKFSTKGVDGIFKTFNATIQFDETKLENASFNMTIDVNSINTGNGLQNKHALGDEWFDAEKYPKIKFTSSSFSKSGTSYTVKGKLQVKNQTKEISIPFTFKKKGKKGTFTTNFSINRIDFGVGKANNDVGNTLKIDATIPVNL